MSNISIVRQETDWLMAHYLPDYRWQWKNAPNTAGTCYQWKKLIELSAPIAELNDPHDFIIAVVLHEIAHGLAPVNSMHDKPWRDICLAIGGNGERCHSLTVPEGKWVGECPVCGKTLRMHRKPRLDRSCGDCSPRVFNSAYRMLWSNESQGIHGITINRVSLI